MYDVNVQYKYNSESKQIGTCSNDCDGVTEIQVAVGALTFGAAAAIAGNLRLSFIKILITRNFISKLLFAIYFCIYSFCAFFSVNFPQRRRCS